MMVDSLRKVAQLDAQELQRHYLKASGTSEALEECKKGSLSLEKRFSQWLSSDYFPSMPYQTTRDATKKILNILSPNITSAMWYDNECHEVSMAIVMAKHIQYLACPPDHSLPRAIDPVRFLFFDTGVPVDPLGLLLAFAKTPGNIFCTTMRVRCIIVFL